MFTFLGSFDHKVEPDGLSGKIVEYNYQVIPICKTVEFCCNYLLTILTISVTFKDILRSFILVLKQLIICRL